MTDSPKPIVERLRMLIVEAAPLFPISSNDTPDYAELTFGEHRTQAMTMEPQNWLSLNALYEALPDLLDHIDSLEADNARMREALVYVRKSLGDPLPIGRRHVARVVDAALAQHKGDSNG